MFVDEPVFLISAAIEAYIQSKYATTWAGRTNLAKPVEAPMAGLNP